MGIFPTFLLDLLFPLILIQTVFSALFRLYDQASWCKKVPYALSCCYTERRMSAHGHTQSAFGVTMTRDFRDPFVWSYPIIQTVFAALSRLYVSNEAFSSVEWGANQANSSKSDHWWTHRCSEYLKAHVLICSPKPNYNCISISWNS